MRPLAASLKLGVAWQGAVETAATPGCTEEVVGFGNRAIGPVDEEVSAHGAGIENLK